MCLVHFVQESFYFYKPAFIVFWHQYRCPTPLLRCCSLTKARSSMPLRGIPSYRRNKDFHQELVISWWSLFRGRDRSDPSFIAAETDKLGYVSGKGQKFLFTWQGSVGVASVLNFWLSGHRFEEAIDALKPLFWRSYLLSVWQIKPIHGKKNRGML